MVHIKTEGMGSADNTDQMRRLRRICQKDSVLDAITKHVEENGADIWFMKKAEDFLPSGYKCEKCGGAAFSKEMDILDVWFDSGISHAAVMKKMRSSHGLLIFILREATSTEDGSRVPCLHRWGQKGYLPTEQSLRTDL